MHVDAFLIANANASNGMHEHRLAWEGGSHAGTNGFAVHCWPQVSCCVPGSGCSTCDHLTKCAGASKAGVLGRPRTRQAKSAETNASVISLSVGAAKWSNDQ